MTWLLPPLLLNGEHTGVWLSFANTKPTPDSGSWYLFASLPVTGFLQRDLWLNPSLLSSLFSKISSERLTLSSLWGEGLVRELGIYTYPLLYLKCITNKVHHIAQGTLLNVMWQPGWEGNLGENGNMYVYSWVALLSTWNYHNIVNWPYSDIKYKNEKKKGSPCSSWNSILLSLSFLLPSFTFHSTGRCLTSPVCSLPLSCTGM